MGRSYHPWKIVVEFNLCLRWNTGIFSHESVYTQINSTVLTSSAFIWYMKNLIKMILEKKANPKREKTPTKNQLVYWPSEPPAPKTGKSDRLSAWWNWGWFEKKRGSFVGIVDIGDGCPVADFLEKISDPDAIGDGQKKTPLSPHVPSIKSSVFFGIHSHLQGKYCWWMKSGQPVEVTVVEIPLFVRFFNAIQTVVERFGFLNHQQ